MGRYGETMAKEAPNSSPVAPTSALHWPVEVMQLLRSASDLSTKSWKSMIATVVVTLTICSLLVLGARFSTSPLMDLVMDLYLMHTKSPASPLRSKLAAAAEEDAKAAPFKELVFLSISFLTSWVSSMAAFYVHESASSATTNTATPPERRGWMGPLVTLRCIAAFFLVYAFFLKALVLALLATAGSCAGFVVVGVVVASVARLLSFSLGMIWGQAMAISMLDEEGCCGVEALRVPLQLLRGLPASHQELPV